MVWGVGDAKFSSSKSNGASVLSNIESLPVPEPNPQMEEESSTVNMFPFPQWVVMVIVIALRKTFSVRSENVWTGGHLDRHLMDI